MEPPWECEMELRRHCACSCDHMGYYDQYAGYTPHPACICRAITSPHVHAAVPDVNVCGQPLPDVAERCTASGQRWASDSTSGSSEEKPTARRPRWRAALASLLLACAILAALVLPLVLGGNSRRTDSHINVIRGILRETPLIDGHNDLAWNVRKFLHNRLEDFNLTAGLRDVEPWSRSKWSQTDIPRLVEGNVGAQFWSAYVPCEAADRDAVQIALEQIDVIKRIIETHSNFFMLAKDSNELLEAHRFGRIASLIGVEGGHAIGDSLAVLRSLYDLGARYLTLTHTCDNRWASAAGSSTGLTQFGRSVIREMNRLGMIIDLSHTAVATAKQVLEITKAPIVFSHSCVASICNSSRNVPDDLLAAVANNNGLIMVNFYAKLVTCSDQATLADVIEHINYIRRIAGINHVGIGAGYDGIDSPPEGLEDVSSYPKLFLELIKDPEWSETDLSKLAGQNMLRVMREVEEVRNQWKLAAVLPGEDITVRRHSCSYGVTQRGGSGQH